MSIIKYRAFVKTVETGSISKTADALGYSQPGISHMIESLEKEFGFPLLQKENHTFIPTENGEKALIYCSEIIKNEDYLRDTVQSINGLLSGTIKIGALNSMLLKVVPTAVKAFTSKYGNVNIQIKEMSYGGILSEIKKGSVDVGFTNENFSKANDFIPLIKEPVYLIVPHDHEFAKQESISVKQLDGTDFIMQLPGFNDLVDAIFEVYRFKPKVKHLVASDIGAIGMVENGLGISAISKQETRLLPEKVKAVEFSEDINRIMGISVRSMKHTSPAIKEFVNVTLEIMKEREDHLLL